MKMRHRAQPADPRDKDNAVPLDQKLHVLVRAEGSKDENPYWIRKVGICSRDFGRS